MLEVRLDDSGNYVFDGGVTPETILAIAEEIVSARFRRLDNLSDPKQASEFLVAKLRPLDHEAFAVVFLDARNSVITFEVLFRGTIDGAAVYPREVVKRALQLGASGVILSHNHPSGTPEPSEADVKVTRLLLQALAFVEVRIVDHIIVGGSTTLSMMERGLFA